VTRWRTGKADIERLLAAVDLQTVTGSAANRAPRCSGTRACAPPAAAATSPSNAPSAPSSAPRSPARYGGLRRRRNEVAYPAYAEELIDPAEAAEALKAADDLIDAAAKNVIQQ
jgi:hypothetical protein